MNLESLFSGECGADPPSASRQGDAIVIDCRGCGLAPVPGSDECIRCMVSAMFAEGGSDRIVLRTGRDVEVSGDAGRAIREVASIRRWSTSPSRARARCRGCPVSREAVMTAVWAGFPRSAVFEGRKAIRNGGPEREECRACLMRTSRTLDQIESGLKRIVSEMGRRGTVPP